MDGNCGSDYCQFLSGRSCFREEWRQRCILVGWTCLGTFSSGAASIAVRTVWFFEGFIAAYRLFTVVSAAHVRWIAE